MRDHRQILLDRSISLAIANVDAGGGPFGAVIADADGRLIAEGCNRVTAGCDPTAHAEIVAIRSACDARRNHRLDGLVLYSSCEPCPMCMAAAWWARLAAVCFASSREAAADAGFDDGRLWAALTTGSTAPTLPVSQARVAAAGREFEHWLRNAGRTPY